ncbi:hypothetical protein B0H11DRAFT_2358278 [Mycena galericulata]|nr:hypothetical protein B0H11DRAFT_2358278 [Mycena galericulata]
MGHRDLGDFYRSLLIEQRNYSPLPPYTFNAAQAAAANAKEGEGAARTAGPLLNKKKAVSEDRECAAHSFLKLGPAKEFGDWMGRLVAPGEIYGVLCTLASLPHSALKTQILENSTFGVYVEQEPYVRQVVPEQQLQDRVALLGASPLAPPLSVPLLTLEVRYFQPFASIKLDRMSNVFRWTVEEVEEKHGEVDPATLALTALRILTAP